MPPQYKDHLTIKTTLAEPQIIIKGLYIKVQLYNHVRAAYLWVRSKIMRQICYKIAQNHISLIHFNKVGMYELPL